VVRVIALKIESSSARKRYVITVTGLRVITGGRAAIFCRIPSALSPRLRATPRAEIVSIEDWMADIHPASELVRHRAMMDGLKQRLGSIAVALPARRPVVYLDYPVHDNVGDLLIHRGADAFLDDHGCDVLGRFSMHDFSRRGRDDETAVVLKPSIRDLDRLVARGNPVLVLHGGGNFGDIWPQFQMFRELIVQRYPDTPIVVFPQSIHFAGAEKRKRAARILAAHKHLVIFVRDEESFEFVSEAGVEGEIVPDMAHQLWGRPEFAATGGVGTLVMRRRDRESGSGGDTDGYFDWRALNGEASRFTLRALRKWQTIDNPLRRVVPNERLWRIYRDRLIRAAVARFQPYACIDTDRLHGVILGALMSKQVRYGEGSYGKLNRYARQWLSGSNLIESGRPREAAE
jgi:pyruvyl transferase EpsO